MKYHAQTKYGVKQTPGTLVRFNITVQYLIHQRILSPRETIRNIFFQILENAILQDLFTHGFLLISFGDFNDIYVD